jgi:hypothetical protein
MKYSIKMHSAARLRGVELLDTPIWNNRTAFDEAEVAYAVAAQANDEGLAPEFSQEKGRQTVAENQWTPEYSVYAVRLDCIRIAASHGKRPALAQPPV